MLHFWHLSAQHEIAHFNNWICKSAYPDYLPRVLFLLLFLHLGGGNMQNNIPRSVRPRVSEGSCHQRIVEHAGNAIWNVKHWWCIMWQWCLSKFTQRAGNGFLIRLLEANSLSCSTFVSLPLQSIWPAGNKHFWHIIHGRLKNASKINERIGFGFKCCGPKQIIKEKISLLFYSFPVPWNALTFSASN